MCDLGNSFTAAAPPSRPAAAVAANGRGDDGGAPYSGDASECPHTFGEVVTVQGIRHTAQIGSLPTYVTLKSSRGLV